MRELGAARGIEIAVHLHLHQVRWNCLQDSVKQSRDESDQDHGPVGTQVFEQPPHQARVVRFAQDFFFVKSVSHDPSTATRHPWFPQGREIQPTASAVLATSPHPLPLSRKGERGE